MEPLAQVVVSVMVSLASASYGHFGVTPKTTPALRHAHVQRSEPIVQRLPAGSAMPQTMAMTAPAARQA